MSTNNECTGDVWYNVSHIALNLGDISLCYQVRYYCIQSYRLGSSDRCFLLSLCICAVAYSCSGFFSSYNSLEFFPVIVVLFRLKHLDDWISRLHKAHLCSTLQSLKLALSHDPTNAEAYTNLGVLGLG